jgi:hypothetical protein
MARFLGSVQGNRGETHRLGSPASGLTVDANGWRGGVRVYLYVENDGADWAVVTLTDGSGSDGREFELYRGPIDEATRSQLRARRANDVLFGG